MLCASNRGKPNPVPHVPRGNKREVNQSRQFYAGCAYLPHVRPKPRAAETAMPNPTDLKAACNSDYCTL
jgi:hypothetical protein